MQVHRTRISLRGRYGGAGYLPDKFAREISGKPGVTSRLSLSLAKGSRTITFPIEIKREYFGVYYTKLSKKNIPRVKTNFCGTPFQFLSNSSTLDTKAHHDGDGLLSHYPPLCTLLIACHRSQHSHKHLVTQSSSAPC